MNQTRYATTVGIFVAVGLGLIALLVLNFSQGLTLFNQTYKLHIIMPSTAGLKPAADVMMSGVPIGKVVGPDLVPGGRAVNITVTILSKYKIPKESVFKINALGFLGDQYVEVTPPAWSPTETNRPLGNLQDGNTVVGEAPFDMLEAVRSTADLLGQARKTIKDLDQAITNINRTVLSDETLESLSLSVSNFASVTKIAVKTVQGADDLVHSNTPAVTAMVTNLEAVSQKLNLMSDQLEQIISTNQNDVHEAIKNLRDTTGSFKQVAAGLQAGEGLAGGLLKDEAMKAEAASLISNANFLAAQFGAFGSNLNKDGIWHMLWKHKKNEGSAEPVH
jgi:phospholipid/cholesterol/gamma-HCH transport system substrate-binding protein